MNDMVSKSDVLDIYAELYDVFDDNKAIQKILNEVYDKINSLKEQEKIVRCKDCLRRGTYDCPVYIGGNGMCSEPDDWYCADGERR